MKESCSKPSASWVYTLDTVKEIGYQLGFDEPTNFIKYFRKHEGCTPKDFRQKINA